MQDPIMSPQTETSFQSYRQYVKYLLNHDDTYEWLHAFFSKQGAQPSETSLVLADSIDNQIRVRDFSSDLAGFHVEIHNRPANIKTRIVLI